MPKQDSDPRSDAQPTAAPVPASVRRTLDAPDHASNRIHRIASRLERRPGDEDESVIAAGDLKDIAQELARTSAQLRDALGVNPGTPWASMILRVRGLVRRGES